VATTTRSAPSHGAHQETTRSRLVCARIPSSSRETPVSFAAVVDESVLRRIIGGPKIMRDQLTALLAVTDRPNVEIRVLPLRSGAHAGLEGSFLLYEMPDPYPDVAYVDSLAGTVYVEEDAAVDRFRQAYAQLSVIALNGKESAALIEAAAKELQ
jgi:Domain of unknown function (DUF5753)